MRIKSLKTGKRTFVKAMYYLYLKGREDVMAQVMERWTKGREFNNQRKELRELILLNV